MTDWPCIHWLCDSERVARSRPGAVEPEIVGTLPPTWNPGELRRAQVSPSSRFLIMRYASRTSRRSVQMSINLADLTESWCVDSGEYQGDGCAVGDKFQVSSSEGASRQVRFKDAATGAEIELDAPRGYLTALTAPWQSAFAGHYAVCRRAEGGYAVTGYAPDAACLWTVPGILSTRALSACGRHYEIAQDIHEPHLQVQVQLRAVVDGRVAAQFQFAQDASTVIVLPVGAIDAGRYLCYELLQNSLPGRFAIYGPRISGFSPVLIRGALCSFIDIYQERKLSLLPQVGHRNVSLVVTVCYVLAVSNATAQPLQAIHMPNMFRMGYFPEQVGAVWERRVDQSAQHELDCARAAVAAVDELPDSGSVDRGSAGSVGLVRAVLAGFVAEDARLTLLRIVHN